MSVKLTRLTRELFLILYAVSLPLIGYAQKSGGFLDELTKRFENYCRTYPWEEIWLKTDRNNYAAGEDIWLKYSLIDRQSLKPANDSRIVYVEVLNMENRPVLQKRLGTENGSGYGKITLPDTLRSGPYLLRAYTNYMKNFLPANCFKLKLNVFNAVSGNGFSGKEAIAPGAAVKKAAAVTQNPPASGFAAEILSGNPDSVVVNIGTTRDFRSREGSDCYLFVETRGNIDFRQSVPLLSNKTVVIVPKKILTPGINHFTIFSQKGNPVAEKFIYSPVSQPSSINVSARDSYKRREKIVVEMSVGKESAGPSGYPDLDVSIIPVTGKTPSDYFDYLVFGSEYGTLPEKAVRKFFDGNFEGDLSGIFPDLKSSWINWETILSDKWTSLNYARENEDHFIYGKLVSKSTGNPDPDEFLFLSIPGKNATFQYALTDRSGNFTFRVPVDSYYRDLIVRPEKSDLNDVIKPESTFSEVYDNVSFLPDTAGSPNGDNTRLKVNYQVEKIYKVEDTAHSRPAPVHASGKIRFYGKPDYELIMDDYIKLPVMQEVFFELLPGVTLKSKKSKYEIIVTDPIELKPFENSPTLMIDGVVVNDPDLIASLDPAIVEKIDVVRERYFVGDYMFYGLVNVITRTGNLGNIPLPDYAVRMNYRVVEPVDSFSSPDYSSPAMKQARVPDMRNTLYWDPSVKPDNNGVAKVEFWSSDLISGYRIRVRGITKDGKPLFSDKFFRIEK